ncbi:DUF317 domain-containing protein [Streptomyces noursei]|uniref:DUF317 domain-containing protein n=1 Tax=Streptomyces noursei TaxID=1971 RepID=UPI0005C8F874|nr:DUF317 domain-containing protein [Streptomyces noursei]
MSIDPFTHLAPDQKVRVLPRHLAGPGPLDLRTVWPFPFDKDWSLHQSPEGAASATSPCLRLWTSFVPEPDSPHQGKWTIAANSVPFGRQAWRITADASTPAELLHDLHTELLDLYREDHHSDRDRLFALDQDHTAPQEVYTPLLVKGWGHTAKTDGTQIFRSPDALGCVRHRYAAIDDRATWAAYDGTPSEPSWRATFSHSAPTTLAAALTASLVSTEPVHRTVQDVPSHFRDHLGVVSTTHTARRTTHSTPVALPPTSPSPGRTR